MPMLRHTSARAPRTLGASVAVSAAVALGVCCVLACVFTTAAAAPSPTYAQPGSAASHTSPIETHHSLNRPFDSHSVYWRYGGATVFTQKAIRLTPATQDRRGWLWNDFPFEKADWEVQFGIRVHATSAFGGDGFAFWMLHSSMDPSKAAGAGTLEGPLFGIPDAFQGFGIAFDTYDNDGARDNPAVFVLKNFAADESHAAPAASFSHNADFSQDMIKDSPSHVYRCTLDYRNSERELNVLARMQNDVLHVYIDRGDSHGFQFCLSVNVNVPAHLKVGKLHMAFRRYCFCCLSKFTSRIALLNFHDLHLSLTNAKSTFSALTGQLADVHEITEITGRYLSYVDPQILDAALERISDDPLFSWHGIFWLFVICIMMLLLFIVGWEANLYFKLGRGQVNAVTVCEKVNAITVPHYSLYFFLNFMLIMGGQWFALMLNVPVVGFRLWSLMQRNRMDITQLHSEKFAIKYANRLYGSIAFYCVLFVYFFSRW